MTFDCPPKLTVPAAGSTIEVGETPLTRVPLRCDQCAGNLYLEAHQEPQIPVSFLFRCLLCGRHFGNAYFSSTALIACGASPHALRRVARGGFLFAWRLV